MRFFNFPNLFTWESIFLVQPLILPCVFFPPIQALFLSALTCWKGSAALNGSQPTQNVNHQLFQASLGIVAPMGKNHFKWPMKATLYYLNKFLSFLNIYVINCCKQKENGKLYLPGSLFMYMKAYFVR